MRHAHRMVLARAALVSHLAILAVTAAHLSVHLGAERAYVAMELSNWRLDFIDAVALNFASNHTSFAVRILLFSAFVAAGVSTGLYLLGRRGNGLALTALGLVVALSAVVNLPYVAANALYLGLSSGRESLACGKNGVMVRYMQSVNETGRMG